jgi:hypothetical protein
MQSWAKGSRSAETRSRLIFRLPEEQAFMLIFNALRENTHLAGQLHPENCAKIRTRLNPVCAIFRTVFKGVVRITCESRRSTNPQARPQPARSARGLPGPSPLLLHL